MVALVAGQRLERGDGVGHHDLRQGSVHLVVDQGGGRPGGGALGDEDVAVDPCTGQRDEEVPRAHRA